MSNYVIESEEKRDEMRNETGYRMFLAKLELEQNGKWNKLGNKENEAKAQANREIKPRMQLNGK